MTRVLVTMIQDQELRRAFGLRLKSLRKQQKWTQKELAARLATSASQLNKYECGVSVPPAEKLVEMAELMGTSIDYLLTGNQADAQTLHSMRLMERFQALEALAAEDREVVIKVIDAMIIKHRGKKA